jgi:AraC-like DNA-binding protein
MDKKGADPDVALQPQANDPLLGFAQRHYTVEEIAAAWNLSPSKVRRLFLSEPGVVLFENRGAFSKRRYRTLRVPESVVERVYRRLQKK